MGEGRVCGESFGLGGKEENVESIERGLPILHTERLVLRAIKESDAEDIFEYASDKENTQFMLFDTHTDIADTRSFIEYLTEKISSGKCKDFVFELKDGGKVIGTGGAFNFTSLHCVEIGYIINKRYWGMGFTVEAMRAIIGYLFSIGVHRIEAFHNSENINSGKVMQKLGMTREGLMKDKYYIKNKYINAVYYSIINPNQQ